MSHQNRLKKQRQLIDENRNIELEKRTNKAFQNQERCEKKKTIQRVKAERERWLGSVVEE